MTEHRPYGTGGRSRRPAPQTDGGWLDGTVIDVDVVDELASITDSEGLSVLTELLHFFLAAVPGRLEAIDRAILAHDLVTATYQAHALAGTSASFGARGMAALCRRLGAAAENDDLEESRALAGKLHAEYLRVRASLVALTTRAG